MFLAKIDICIYFLYHFNYNHLYVKWILKDILQTSYLYMLIDSRMIIFNIYLYNIQYLVIFICDHILQKFTFK